MIGLLKMGWPHLATSKNQRNIDIGALNAFLMQKYEMRIANGYGDLKGKTFRIATMGEATMKDVDALLTAVEEYLNQ